METVIDIGWLDVGRTDAEDGETEESSADETRPITDALLIIELL